jgi:hypothetical protein
MIDAINAMQRSVALVASMAETARLVSELATPDKRLRAAAAEYESACASCRVSARSARRHLDGDWEIDRYARALRVLFSRSQLFDRSLLVELVEVNLDDQEERPCASLRPLPHLRLLPAASPRCDDVPALLARPRTLGAVAAA